MPSIYVSLPLTGPAGRLGRDLLRGIDLAHARDRTVELTVLDAFGEDRDAKAVAHTQRAAADPEALAYIGDLHSSQVDATADVHDAAELLHIAPVATWTGLHGSTLVRLTPDDRAGAAAIAAWLEAAAVHELLIVHDHDAGYGVPVGGMCADAARERGLSVSLRPIWDHDEPWRRDVDGKEAVLYVGVAGSGAVGLWHDLHGANPELWLLGSEGVAVDWLARELSDAEAARTRFFVAQHAPFAFYGFEAMALALDAIADGGDGRAGTVRAARATRDRDSILGRYSIDAEGRTTSTTYGRLTVADAELAWDRSEPGTMPGSPATP